MSKRFLGVIGALAALLILVMVVVQPGIAANSLDKLNQPPNVPAQVPAAQQAEKYGLAAGSVEDRGFNQLAWEGMQRAADEFGVEVNHLETEADNAEQNLAQFVNEGYNGIVSVGFDLSSATRAASRANPSVPFANVDFPSQSAGDVGLLFSVDEAALLAGYLAAGMSQTGTVCTYGGTQVPPVMAFMVGFEHGIEYYNEQNSASVTLLGWQTDPSNTLGGTGTFAGNYTNPEDGRAIAEDFFGQDCDIIFPVAGAVGLGSAEAAQEQGRMVIGVDADTAVSNPDFAEVYLTSVLKKVDVAVYEVVRAIHEGTFKGGGNFIGTLQNGMVGLAPFHSFESKVPAPLKTDLGSIKQAIIDGTISTGWPIVGTGTVRRLTPQVLQNTTYPVEYTADGTAPLADGMYEEEAAPGSAAKTTIRLSDLVAFGDLDADKVDDAAVVLISDTSGSGRFYDLFAVLDRNGKGYPVASVFLGDRIEVNALTIEDGHIVVDMLTRGPGEAMADEPTQQVTQRYGLQVSLVQQEGDDLSQLKNATYSGIYEEPVTLTDGIYEGEPFVEGSAARPTVTFVDDVVAYGDLNGDGVDDAVVLLAESSGGSGVFTYMAAMVNQDGEWVNADTVLIGDRTQIKSMTIQDGQVVLEVVTQGPNDPMCCPSLKVRTTYALQDGELVEVSSEELGTVSLQDLDGTSWDLQDFNFDRQPVLPDTPITLEFAGDQISGSGGCNSYNASVSSAGGQALTVGPIAATKMACPDPIMDQETQYFTALQNVMQWSYLAGQLALTYQNEDGSIGTLVYAPAQ